MAALVEVHDAHEARRAIDAGAEVVGVNSRDLETLAIDTAVTQRLVPLIPGARVAVAESGVAPPSAVRRAAAGGADAVLVGSAVSAADDPAAVVRALTGVARVFRAA